MNESAKLPKKIKIIGKLEYMLDAEKTVDERNVIRMEPGLFTYGAEFGIPTKNILHEVLLRTDACAPSYIIVDPEQNMAQKIAFEGRDLIHCDLYEDSKNKRYRKDELIAKKEAVNFLNSLINRDEKFEKNLTDLLFKSKSGYGRIWDERKIEVDLALRKIPLNYEGRQKKASFDDLVGHRYNNNFYSYINWQSLLMCYYRPILGEYHQDEEERLIKIQLRKKGKGIVVAAVPCPKLKKKIERDIRKIKKYHGF